MCLVLYVMIIIIFHRSYAATGEGEEGGEADKVIDGRLRVPGSIWNRLYRFVNT